jgi:RNA polymerase sigma factor (sigma-70 family)
VAAHFWRCYFLQRTKKDGRIHSRRDSIITDAPAGGIAFMPRNRVEQQLRQVSALSDAQAADGLLLEAFLVDRDEAAFTALVRRYGPMVFGICRRVLRHQADAEDAFQATFLVLVRRAAQVRCRATLGNWLYGVAYRTALHARTVNARRRRLEGQVRAMQQPEAPDEAAMQPELQQLLDQELSRLPAKYREVIVLCDLLGKTLRDAAQQLRCPEGTVSSRLARGRELLRKQFARHGPALSLAALAALLEQNKVPASAPLIDNTVKTAALVAAGNLAAAGGVAPNAAALMEGVLKSMLLTKLKIVAVLLIVFAVLGATTTLIASRYPGGPPVTPPPSGPERGAAEKVAQAKAEEPAPDKEQLRYEGKNFGHWRDVLRNELKPAIRIEALQALGAFGANGYAEEVAVVILDVMRAYDPTRDNRETEPVTAPPQPPGRIGFGNLEPPLGMGTKFMQTAQDTLAQIGPPVLPAVMKDWEKRSLKQRRFLAETLKLMNVMKDEDAAVRLLAVDALNGITWTLGDGSNGRLDLMKLPRSKEVRAVLIQLLKEDKDVAIRQAALTILGYFYLVNCPEILSAMLEAAQHDKAIEIRRGSVDALGTGYRISAWWSAGGADVVVGSVLVAAQRGRTSTLTPQMLPVMLKMLEKEDDEVIRVDALGFFTFLPAWEKGAIPGLVKALRFARNSAERQRLIKSLEEMGPAAKEAVPALNELLDGKQPETDPKVREAAAKALKAIQPEP